MPPRKTYPSDSDQNHEEYPDFFYYDLFVSQGLSYYNLGQNERAIEDYDKAIKLDPDNAEAYNKLKMRIV